MTEAHPAPREWVAGRYRLVDIVHREANRVCWHGEDAEDGRPCLLTRVGLPGGADPAGARRAGVRLLRMSETMGRLCPDRVPQVLDAVVEAGGLWTVTEWVDGVPLGELLRRQRTFNPFRAARIGLELLDVLHAAHTEGITHGELSPGQVLVPERGPVLVTGFGAVGATTVPRLAAPSYAAPEQARDQRIGPAADLWALGALLYTMVEGRPPFRERERPEATLRDVDRLPVRTPVRAGPLTRVVQGLLRKDSRDRLSRPVVHEALHRVLNDEPEAVSPDVPAPRLRLSRSVARPGSPAWSGRTLAAGTALAVVTVAVAVLAVAHGLPGTGAPEADTRPSPSATTPEGSGRPPTREPTAAPSGVPAGFRRYDAPEGFSVALPDGWRRLRTTRASAGSFRAVFGAEGDTRTLAVTYSARVGPDPVAVWRDDVEPGLEAAPGYHRIGAIRATTYQGRRAADMEWLAGSGTTRVRTFGRGVLLGGGRGYSLRFTAPAAAWGGAADRLALQTFLRTFRPGRG
ncbi:serine/threonine protein kinase [Streptomyces sp. MS06]|uniref:serine/threonine protein kinase n=1 Tax=Streptomyces sp. MS06 TaxID=3385974 RepID=UPI0039A2412D